jgi:hypothetical protein
MFQNDFKNWEDTQAIIANTENFHLELKVEA